VRPPSRRPTWELLAPGVASAGSVGLARGEAVEADGTAIRRLAYTRAAHEAIARTEADLAAAAAALDAAPLDRSGTVAVRARNVRNTTDISTSAAERELGGVLVDRGFDVDLDDPDHVLRALFAAGERDDHEAVPGADGGDSAVCALGWVAVEAARDFAPKPTDRPFFQPGSMSPTDARAYANLAGAAPDGPSSTRCAAPAGSPLEAGIVGSDVIACDAQTKMVRGTRENLREYLNTALDDSGPDWHVARGDATALPCATTRSTGSRSTPRTAVSRRSRATNSRTSWGRARGGRPGRVPSRRGRRSRLAPRGARGRLGGRRRLRASSSPIAHPARSRA